MSKIFYLMGKSASGKDTLFKKIKETMPELKEVCIYTTRPIREGEKNGREYFFTDEEGLREWQQKGKVIELRQYDTIHGIWNYFTVDDGQFDVEGEDLLMIGTLESYQKMQSYFGKEKMVPLYIEVDDGERLDRALQRERRQDHPKYKEMCRRFLADAEDFSEEKLKEAGITYRFLNDDVDKSLKEITEKIKGYEKK